MKADLVNSCKYARLVVVTVALSGAFPALAVQETPRFERANPEILRHQTQDRERLIERAEEDRQRQREQQEVRAADGKKLKLSPKERKAIYTLANAVEEQDSAAALKALQVAKTVSQSAEAEFAVATLQLKLGVLTNDQDLQSQAVDLLIEGGQVPADQQAALYSNQGVYALKGGNLQKAEAAFAKLVELSPTDPAAYMSLADAKIASKNYAEAAPLVEKAISLQQSTNQQVPESWTQLNEQLKQVPR